MSSVLSSIRGRFPSVAAFLMTFLPAVALASGEGGHGFSLKVNGFYVINFLIFVAILAYVAGPAIKKAIKERAERTSKRLTSARELAQKAGAEAADARSKVGGMEDEKAELVARMDQEGGALADKINKRSVEEAAKIKAGVEAALEGEKARLEKAVMTEVALEALAKAEAQLKATWQTLPHDRYVTEFADALKTLPSMGPAGQEKLR